MAKKSSAKKGVTRKKGSSKKTPPASSLLQLAEFRVIARLVVAFAFVAAIIWLVRLPASDSQSIAPTYSSDDDPATSVSRYTGKDYDNFTFYSKLRDFEVQVRKDNPYNPEDAFKTSYLIQAGAFKELERADEQLVILTLLDLDARIEREGTWYRLLIGPLSSRSAMSSARERLLDNGIEAQVMKRREKRN